MTLTRTRPRWIEIMDNPTGGLLIVLSLITLLWYIGACMPVYDKCDAPGCFKEKGRINANCPKCHNEGFVETDAPNPMGRPIPTGNTYLHDFECYMKGTEKIMGEGRLWICSKCSYSTDQLIPETRGCDVEGEPKDPVNLIAALRTAQRARVLESEP